MKYYSETLRDFFDTEEELKEKEALQEEQMMKKEKREVALKKEKKELAEAIDILDDKINDKIEEYEKVKEEALKLVEDAKKQAEAMLKPARENITIARKAKYEAIKDFNEKFGPYSVMYTGDKAYNEMMRTMDYFNNVFNDFFW